MSLLWIRAQFRCDGCAKPITFELDPGGQHEEPLFDIATRQAYFDIPLEGGGFSSVQGSGKVLCPKCTTKVDSFVTEDREATDEEISEALLSDAEDE